LEKIKNEKLELEKNLASNQEENKHINENINQLRNHNVELERKLDTSTVEYKQINDNLEKN